MLLWKLLQLKRAETKAGNYTYLSGNPQTNQNIKPQVLEDRILCHQPATTGMWAAIP